MTMRRISRRGPNRTIVPSPKGNRRRPTTLTRLTSVVRMTRFHRFFLRTEGRELSRKYLIGLNLPIERKNVENIAEKVGAQLRTIPSPPSLPSAG